MAMRRKRKAAEVAREAIRTTMQTIKKKHRKSIRKHPLVHIKKINSIISQQDNVMIASSESQSNQLGIQAGPNQSTSYDKNRNSLSTQADDPVYDQLKQLPDKLLVQLPCGVIRDAAERLKHVNYSAQAGFIIFRTDLHPFNQGHKQKSAH